jgi:hypothetical protein
VDHLRLDFLGQGVQHACGNVCIELNQEDRDRLGMFVADERHQHLRGEPAGEFQRGRRLFRRNPLHQAFGFHFADGPGHHRAHGAHAVGHDQAEPFGPFDEPGNRLGNRGGADFTQFAHLFAQAAQFARFELAEQLRGLLVLEQHDHHGGTFGVAADKDNVGFFAHRLGSA